MVSVFFYCSSPYIGYTLKQADYANKEMKSVSEKDMTSIGYKLFNSSGSTMVLGEFDKIRYFHTRQSQSENYDEQGRRIYTNIAFVGEKEEEKLTINKIAMYIMFNEQRFYKEIATMIKLLDDGFTIDFDKLSLFINRFLKSNIFLETNNSNAIKFFDDVMNCANKEISFIITESTWSYFVKQAKYDFNESVLYKLTIQEAEVLTDDSTVVCNDDVKSKDDSTSPPSFLPFENKVDGVTAETETGDEIDKISKTNDKKLLDKKDEEIKKLRRDINNICAERNSFEAEVAKLKTIISDLKKNNIALKDEQKHLKIISVFKGIIGTVLAALIILVIKWIF